MSNVTDFYQVQNPRTPYMGDIPDGLYTGKSVFIILRINHNFKEFIVNLETGNDIAFRFNPKLEAKSMSRNAQIAGEWGEEEADGEFEFVSGRKYGLQIETTDEGFIVRMTGKELFTFKHRLPVTDIEAIIIKGDLIVEDIVFTN